MAPLLSPVVKTNICQCQCTGRGTLSRNIHRYDDGYPKDEAKLTESGPFSVVRHPIYSGGFVLCLGWALYIDGWLTLVYVLALFVLLDAKARREEKWLVEKFPAYTKYQQRVRKLIPFIY